MSTRIEQRLTRRLASLTLRKAVGLIVAVATLLAVSAAVLERLIDPAFQPFRTRSGSRSRPSAQSGTATTFPRAAPAGSSPLR